MHQRLRLRVNGSTSNLGAGFDALGLALELPLRVTFHFNSGKTGVLSVAGHGATQIRQSRENLVLHAFDRVCRKIGEPAPQVAITINNRIPLKRGLGSSGAAIVAGLLAANAYFGSRLAQQQLLDMACELEGHPENASASLLGGLTINGVDQGRVICQQLLPPPSWVAAGFVPDLEISTKDARRVLPESLSRQQVVNNIQAAAMMVAAFANGRPAPLNFAAQDSLHQPYRKALIPGYDEVMAAALRGKAYCVFLSGSGSALLSICDHGRASQVAGEMAAAAAAQGLSGRPIILPFARSRPVCEHL